MISVIRRCVAEDLWSYSLQELLESFSGLQGILFKRNQCSRENKMDWDQDRRRVVF